MIFVNQGVVRHVVLLQTDERAGLVASLANTCAERGVSLEISTGPGHVLITFAASEKDAAETLSALGRVAGVADVHAYTVATGSPA